VMINSGPGSPPAQGQAGSLVPPMKSKDANEADKADPGEMDKIKRQQIQEGEGKYGLVSLTRHKPPTASQSGQPGAEGKTHWIEIELVDEDGKPVPGEEYQVTLPDGSTVASGTLDGKGKARVEGIDPGSCKVTFPNLDKDSWKPK
jgi:type VI secretion system secreted protein VgrG